MLLQVSIFLTWSQGITEVFKAMPKGTKESEMTLELPGGVTWWQTVGGPQKYHTKSLAVLKNKYAEVAQNAELDAILERTGCKLVLAGGLGPKAKL